MNLENIFSEAIKNTASDIHLVVNLPPILRINGALNRLENYPPISEKDLLDFVEKELNDLQKKNLFNKRELDLSYETKKEKTRLRLNLFWDKGNLALAARIIWPHIPTMEELDLPPITYDLVKLHQGLVIITGPAGSGKSTTLASMINYINEHRTAHIITLEDPIEFVFSSKKSVISQRELGQDMLSFAAALKHVLRQDPNIVMVGEMRDLETIALAVTLAETGHLILATLHTPSTPQTISRIIDVFPPNQQYQIRLELSQALKAIICQHLIPTLDGKRTAAREVLINIPAIANLIRENQVQQIISSVQTGASHGMFTMAQDLKRLYANKIISQDTLLSYTKKS